MSCSISRLVGVRWGGAASPAATIGSATALVLSLVWAFPVRAGVYINEVSLQPVGSSQTVELYNSGPGGIDVGGWEIRGSKGAYIIPAPEPIPAGGYVVLSVGNICSERGGVMALIDLVASNSPAADAVNYGQRGSAPLPPAGTSLARAPDASAGPPPAPDPAGDGLVWTIDLTPTFGGINDAPTPNPGSSAALNELDPRPIGGGDSVELYNPTPSPIILNNWFLCNGTQVQFLNGFLPPFSFYVFATGIGLDLEEVGLVYLFDNHGVRVDQLAFWDGPSLSAGNCYERCPDGAPPHLGYDFSTSGGWTTFGPLPCTPGATNGISCRFPISGVGSPPPVHSGTWGRIKGTYR